MLQKGFIEKVCHCPREFISNLFSVDKTDDRKRLVNTSIRKAYIL